MADTTMNLAISITARNLASSVISGIASSFGPLGVAVAAIGAAAVMTGVQAVKMAANFQSGLTTLVTGAGESQKNLGLISDGILNMAVTTGTSTQQLISGMYMIDSATSNLGQQGDTAAKRLQILQAVAEGSKVGVADMGTVANATTTIMADYASSNVTAVQAVNTLVATVANGKTTMQELSASLSQIMPTASAAGVSLKDTSAALATMTGEGVPAANAATYLRQTIMNLDAPSKAAETALNSVGLTTTEVSNEMKISLPDALKMITDAVGKQFPVGSAAYINAIKNISGGTKTMQGMLDLTGTHMSSFQANVLNIAQAVNKGGSSITGWSQVQQTFNFKMSQAKEVVETLMIRIGTALLPVLTKLMNQVMPLITKFSEWIVKSGALKAAAAGLQSGIAFVVSAITHLVTIGMALANFFAHNQTAMLALKSALAGAAVVIAVVVVTAFISWAIAAGAAAIATIAATWPLLALGAVVAVVAFIIVEAITHWGAIISFFAGLWHTVWSAVSSFFIGIWNGIKNFFVGIWNAVVGFFKAHILLILSILGGPFVAIIIQVVTHWTQIKAFFVNLWNDVVNIFKEAIGWIGQAIANIWNTMVNIVRTWPAKAMQWGIDLIKGLISGITSMIGGIGNAVGGIASKIAGFLHFTHPDEGPLAAFDSWMPHMGDNLSTGIVAQVPKMQAALNRLTLPMQAALSVHGPAALAVAPPALAGAGASPASGSGPVNMQITVHIHAAMPLKHSQEAKELAEVVAHEIGQKVRLQHPGYSQGVFT